MTPETVEQKAARYLAEGRLRVTFVDGLEARAVCLGDSGTEYRLGRSPREPDGFCGCPARTRRCSHLLALALVAPTIPRRKKEAA